MMLESLRPFIGLRVWEVTKESRPRVFGPQVIALDEWNYQSADTLALKTFSITDLV